MLVVGITSKVARGLQVFFWEYDDVSEYEALEEANYLSSLFDFDVYVSESSPRHYHLVSCDIMTVNEVEQAQRNTTFEGDYLTLKETGLYRMETKDDLKGRCFCALRLGDKGRKQAPRFIKAFYRGSRLKSLGHYRMFQHFCKFPPLPDAEKSRYVSTNIQLTIYNTGKGAKPKIKPKNTALYQRKP